MWQTLILPEAEIPIRAGLPADFNSILELYKRVTRMLELQGMKQWDADYPGRETLLNDLEAGTLFVVEKNGDIQAVVVLDDNQHPQYSGIDWTYKSDKVLVIHRLAVDPMCSGQGIAQALCRFCEHVGLSAGYEVIRLDAYRGNKRSNTFYQKQGYRKTLLSCQFDYQDFPCDCYEKLMRS